MHWVIAPDENNSVKTLVAKFLKNAAENEFFNNEDLCFPSAADFFQVGPNNLDGSWQLCPVPIITLLRLPAV